MTPAELDAIVRSMPPVPERDIEDRAAVLFALLRK